MPDKRTAYTNDEIRKVANSMKILAETMSDNHNEFMEDLAELRLKVDQPLPCKKDKGIQDKRKGIVAMIGASIGLW